MVRRFLPGMLAALTAGCIAQVITRDGTALHDPDVLRGDLWIASGSAALEEGSQVDGSVILTGGSLTVSGEITGDILILAGSIQLQDHAVVRGTMRAAAGAHVQAEGAQIQGDSVTNLTPAGVLGRYLLRQYITTCGLPTILLAAILYLLLTRRHHNDDDESTIG